MWLGSTCPDHFLLSVAGAGSGGEKSKVGLEVKGENCNCSISTEPPDMRALCLTLSKMVPLPSKHLFYSHFSLHFSSSYSPTPAAEAFTGSGRMEALSFWPHSPPSSSPFHFLSLASFSGSHVIADLSRVLTLSWWTRSLPPPLIKDPRIFSVFLVFVHLSFYWLIYLDDSNYQASISSVLNWFLSNSFISLNHITHTFSSLYLMLCFKHPLVISKLICLSIFVCLHSAWIKRNVCVISLLLL